MISPRRATGIVTYNRRPRSLWGSITTVLVQPIVFYQAFPAARQWLVVAAIILALYGFSAVNQPSAETTTETPAFEAPVFSDPSGGMGVPSGIEGGFIPPTDVGGGGANPPAQSSNVSRTVMTALLAAGGVVLTWFIQALILSEVSLINGIRPSFGRNFQIAVWAAVPLGVMLLIQQIYFAAGGEPGQMGLSLLLERWNGYATLPPFSRAVLMTLAANFTLFWLWSLVLLYLGGRYVLNGKRAAVLLVVVVWVIISVLLPALTSPALSESSTVVPERLELDSGELAPDGSFMPGDSDSILPMETQDIGATEEPMLNSEDSAPNTETNQLEEAPASELPQSEAPVRSNGAGG
jgi:hypothetical protein